MKKATIWQEEINQLKEIIQQTPLAHSVKWGMDVYTLEGKNIVGISGFKSYFGLWFYNGVFLSDPKGVLVSAQEGKTKAMRQWRFQSAEEIDEAGIMDYLQEAIQLENEGKRWTPEKSDSLEIPQVLATALEQDAVLLENFESLSPYKRKEYVGYISSPKQEKTRTTRLEKCLPLILDGKGLNDQYK
ncbi:YdeI/OmpD-associated family protein [Lunatimonas salinarum]|uniref:YdeI/OmpD-associated family protein n=1 Tax=Lunatimonas salinarum TaxID=1774590 RepID=UPI001ADECF97|nr:DUF1801 domain-containing protein [Lunatimonas salinarum]